MRLSSLVVIGDRWGKMVNDALQGQKVIALFWNQSKEAEDLDLLAIGRTGTAAELIQMQRLSDDTVQIEEISC